MAVKKNKDVKKEKKVTEDTTRIRIDGDRINDASSLDVSFLEGKRGKTNKEKLLKEKKDYSLVFNVFKFIIILIIIIGLGFLGYKFIKNSNILNNDIFKTKKVEEVKKEGTNKKIGMDYNYLFIGDNYTDGLNFDEFYKPYVKVSDSDYTTTNVLDNLRDYIYVYNPTHVFIELGVNDFKDETSISEVVDNIKGIIEGIQSNRSMATIYVESLYPINSKMEDYDEDEKIIDNDVIKDINAEIETMCKNLKVKYINMYDELSENDLLKEDYTSDGINLNEDGYKKVFKVINRYIN